MRKKELKLVVTFHTTTDAMAVEKICKAKGLPGRLIPVPREISAGCGFSWAAPLESKAEIRQAMIEAGIAEQDMHEIMI